MLNQNSEALCFILEVNPLNIQLQTRKVTTISCLHQAEIDQGWTPLILNLNCEEVP